MDLAQERHIKHQRVTQYLRGHQLDGVLLSQRANFSWYTCGLRNYVSVGSETGNCHMLVTEHGAIVITSNIETPRLRLEDFAGADAPANIEIVEFPYYDLAQRAKVFAELMGGRRIACDSILPLAPAPLLAGDFARLRWSLTESEIERYRSLCNDTVAAVEFVARDAEPGTSEHELGGMVAGALRACGCVPWIVLASADERAEKFRHPLPTGRQVRRFFMLSVVAERGGLMASTSRLVSFGPIDDLLARKHEAAAMIDAAMITSTHPGVPYAEIFKQAQAAYARSGFPHEWQLCDQGGSTGYLPRELLAAPAEQTQVLPEQAFAWNATISPARCEDTII